MSAHLDPVLVARAALRLAWYQKQAELEGRQTTSEEIHRIVAEVRDADCVIVALEVSAAMASEEAAAMEAYRRKRSQPVSNVVPLSNKSS